MRCAALLLLAALAACGPAEDAPPEESEQLREAPTPAERGGPPPAVEGLDATEIEGEWRLAGVGEEVLSQPFGVAVSIRGDTIRTESGCVAWNWRYRLEDGAFEAVAQNRSLVTAPPGSETARVCAGGPTEDERAIEAAMTRVDRAERRPDASLHLSGGGSSLTLYTQ